MSFEAQRPLLRIPTNPASGDVGASVTSVVVQSVDPSARPPVAICVDPMGRPIPVRIDFQRGKGSVPAPNERWVIDKMLGFWSFAALQDGDPTGAGSVTSTSAVAGLDAALSEKTAVIDDSVARLDEMWTLATITAVQGTGATTADIRLSDGTTLTEVPVLGTYAPAVGEVVWTARADAAGSRVIVGPSALSTADSYGYRANYYVFTVRGETTLLGGLTGTSANFSGRMRSDTALVDGRFDAYEVWASNGVRSLGGLSCVGNFVGDANGEVGLRMTANNFEVSGNSIFSRPRDGAIRWDPTGALEVCTRSGAGYRGVYATNFAPPPSWRAYKLDTRPIEDFLGSDPGVVIDNLDLDNAWTYDPNAQTFDDGTAEYIGPKLDEVPEVLRLRRIDENGEDRSSWGLTGMLTVALAELQRLRRRVHALENP